MVRNGNFHTTIVLFFIYISSFSQIERSTSNYDDNIKKNAMSGSEINNLPDSKSSVKDLPNLSLYKIISSDLDTTIVDTSLTIQKFYKYNYLRRDTYKLLPFANTGQTYNTLVKDEHYDNIAPLFGARAKHFNYLEETDIKYYEVPTPLTELYYKSVFEQGQTLDAFFTMNLSRKFNFSIAYKGMRSLGKYKNVRTSTGNFRFTSSYQSPNDKYALRFHYVAQGLTSQENGGLTEDGIADFKSGDDNFNDRSRLELNFEDAENTLDGQRIYLDHRYEITNPADSLDNHLSFGHRLIYRDKFYTFTQSSPKDLFGPSFAANTINDRTDLEELSNRVSANYVNSLLGQLTFHIDHNFYDYGYNSVLINDQDERIPNRLQGNLSNIGANYRKEIYGFAIQGKAKTIVAGDFDGYDLQGLASYEHPEYGEIEAAIHLNSREAHFNKLLYQSNYLNYNWYNADNFDNVKTAALSINIRSPKYANVKVGLSNITNFAYFERDTLLSAVRPQQASEGFSLLDVTVQKELRLGKFALNNQVTYQQVAEDISFFNIPKLVTRNTLYYTDRWFDDALFVQTGINFKYFTEYNMDAYDPVLAEFYVQNDENLGAFPLVDIFFNMKIQQTRVFFIAEHINAFVSDNDYFSAPGHPYRDFAFRFGLVWNFFL
ncbi:MAG: putative porin [Leeuwenhoekiella sp.]